MSFSEYYNRVIEAVLNKIDGGKWFIEPWWIEILTIEDLTIDKCNIENLSYTELFNMLDLEVKKRNAIDDKTNYIIEYLYNLLVEKVEPATLNEENELVKNVLEYMKNKELLKEKKEELDKREDVKKNKKKLPEFLNFSKKEI